MSGFGVIGYEVVLGSLLSGLLLGVGDAEAPRAVPTFECIGLYWKAPGGAADKVCEVRYGVTGEQVWRTAFPLWFDARNQEYRGSIVNLRPGTTYEIALKLEGTDARTSLRARTWSETFPAGKTIALPGHSSEPLTITESGSPDGYVLYAPGGSSGATIDVDSRAECCVVVKGSYVILRGVTLRNAQVHGVQLREGVHDVVIEECDISGWGRVLEDGWGRDYDSAIYARSADLKRVIVQRNRIHHPRSNSNNWREPRPRPGKREPSHPEGPQAVCFWDSDGNHVIRYNTIFSDDAHQYNDIFGAGANFSLRGFPNRDSDIYGNLLSHCWDDAIESEGANCNVRIWGNYMTDVFVGVACASASIGPLYVWRNVMGVSRVSPSGAGGGFLKTSDKMGGGKIYAFHNTILQLVSAQAPNKTLGASMGLGWGGPMTNVTSRNNLLHVTRQAIADRARSPLNDFDYDLCGAPFSGAEGQEKHGVRGLPIYATGHGMTNGRGVFALAAGSPGFDAGETLPNFNDDFAGAAPDLGAQEAGTPPMEFGVGAGRAKAGWGGADKYRFDQRITREVLENYLSRAITMEGLLNGAGDLEDNIRMLKYMGAKFIGRSLCLWGGEANLLRNLERAKQQAPKVHAADSDMVLQACIFEIVTTQVDQVPVPEWAFAAFGLAAEKRNFRYDGMLYPNGRFKNHWRQGQSVPDVSQRETKLWFYFLGASFIDVGCEAIHFGQTELMNGNDKGLDHYSQVLTLLRTYAAQHARRHLLLCDSHVPSGGLVRDGRLLMDFHSFPLRIMEVPDQPQEAILKVGFSDGIYGRSKGGMTFSGWKCEHLPYLVEIDNWGASRTPGQAKAGGIWIWGYDEITWFAHQSQTYRSNWLHYARNWVQQTDPNGHLQMPGSRTVRSPRDGMRWYYANKPSAAVPEGFGDEEAIRAIWATDPPKP